MKISRNKNPEETVQRILDVSLKLFLEKGYEQTTILDIVNNLGGLTRGAFYHHFKSKEEVLSALQNRRSYEGNPFERIKDEKMSGLEKIKMLMTHNIKSQFEDEKELSLTNATICLLSNPRFLAEHVKENHVISRMFESMIEEGMQDGSIKKNNSKLLSELLMLLFNFWMLPHVYPYDDKKEVVEKFMMIKQMFDNLGLPIIDQELIEEFNSIDIVSKLLEASHQDQK